MKLILSLIRRSELCGCVQRQEQSDIEGMGVGLWGSGERLRWDKVGGARE